MTSPTDHVRRPARRLGAAACAAALLALAACGNASGEGRLSVMAEEPAAPVPDHVDALGILEPDSIRLLGSADGVEYYVGAQAGTRGIVCLVPVRTDTPDEGGGAACATESAGVIVTLTDVHGEAALVADDAGGQVVDELTADGWTEVSQNLWTR